MAPGSAPCVSLVLDVDDHKWRKRCSTLEGDQVMELLCLFEDGKMQEHELQSKFLKMCRAKLSQGMIYMFTHFCAHAERVRELESVTACNTCDDLLADFKNAVKEVHSCNRELHALKSENEMLKSSASMPCNSCVTLQNDLDRARDEIALLETNASLPCVSCESLVAEINKLKFTYTTCVEQLEHARAKIDEIESMPCSTCSLVLEEVACLTSCDNHNALLDVDDDTCSCGLICTSCIDLENEVLVLKQMRNDMSAKLVEHDEMSANLEKEIDFLHTTYVNCIEKEMDILRNAPCGTCESLKHENEVLLTRCKNLSAKSFDSRISCHSEVDVSNLTSSQPESVLCVERESLDVGIRASALDSSPVASPKLVASSGVAQGKSNGKGASCSLETQPSRPKFHCTFCEKDGHTIGFCFRRVKHERRVRAKSRKSRSLSHGTCDPSGGTKVFVDASCSTTQRISRVIENGISSSRTEPPSRPLYHCSHCKRAGHQKSFCYRRAKQLRRVRFSRPLDVHSRSHGMNTCVPKKKSQFVDGLFDSFSSGVGHDR